MRLVYLESCYTDLRHGQLTGIMLTYSKGFIRIASAGSQTSYTLGNVVPKKACSTSIKRRLIIDQMHWAGLVVRMGDGRLPKNSFVVN